MVSNHPWVTDDQSIVPKPTFFFGDAVPDDSTYQRRCFQFSYIADGEKRTIFYLVDLRSDYLDHEPFPHMLKEGRSSKLGEEDKRDQDWGFCWQPFWFCREVACPYGHFDAGQRLPRFRPSFGRFETGGPWHVQGRWQQLGEAFSTSWPWHVQVLTRAGSRGLITSCRSAVRF